MQDRLEQAPIEQHSVSKSSEWGRMHNLLGLDTSLRSYSTGAGFTPLNGYSSCNPLQVPSAQMVTSCISPRWL